MDLKKEFGTNVKKEVEGVWCDFGEGCECLIARTGNPENRKAFEKIARPHRKRVRRGTLSDEVAEKISIQVTAESILLDWKGIEEDGKPVKYSAKNAIKLLTAYRDFREQVNEFADDMNMFKIENDEEAEKN